jgi:hypothetical protein
MAVQVEGINTRVKSAYGFRRSALEDTISDEPLSNVALNFQLAPLHPGAVGVPVRQSGVVHTELWRDMREHHRGPQPQQAAAHRRQGPTLVPLGAQPEQLQDTFMN